MSLNRILKCPPPGPGGSLHKLVAMTLLDELKELIYIFSIYMYCVIFVTVCKIKIPHNGRYFTKGNIVMKAKIVFLLQIS